MSSIHTKTNLTCKCLCFERLVTGAATHFTIPPSELVVVDLCASHAKDLSNLETTGIRQCNYYGFDNDIESPSLAQKYARSNLNLVTCVNLVESSDDAICASIQGALIDASRSQIESPKAHIVLINFAIHLFAKDLEKVFRLISNGDWAHKGCLVQCSYISYEGIHTVIETPHVYGEGVSFHKDSRVLHIENMAKYSFDECMRRMVPSIVREEHARSFANNGVAEVIVSDESLCESLQRQGFECICAKDELSHIKLYNESIRTHVASHVTERARLCLEAFMTIHKTIICKQN